MASNAPRLISNAGLRPCFRHKLAASQTFIKGALVIFNGSGYIAEAGATPSVVYGLAMENATSGTAGQYDVLVQPIVAGDIYKFDLVDADTLAQANIGTSVGLVKETHWAIDISDTGDQVLLLEPVLEANDGIGDARSVFVTFDEANIQNA